MMTTDVHTRPTLTIAGSDLDWLLAIMQASGNAFASTVVHERHPVTVLKPAEGDAASGAVVELDQRVSVTSLHELFDRCPNVHFVFVADALPLRHTVANLIRRQGHAVLPRHEPPFVIAATVVALLSEPPMP